MLLIPQSNQKAEVLNPMINSVLLEVSGPPQRENASELNQMLELHVLSFSQAVSITAILNFIIYSLFLSTCV